MASCLRAIGLAVLLAGLGAGRAAGQERLVRGRVVAQGTQEPLAGAALRAAGERSGVCTGRDGSFELQVPAGAVRLELAVPGWIGYVALEPDESDVTLQLNPDVIPIAPLIVAARRRGMQDGATRATIVGDAQPAAPDVKSMLQGRVPGAMLITGSGQVGSGFRLTLRGISSLTGSNDPLVVVDGVVMSSPATDPGTSPLSRMLASAASPGGLQDLNPEDIEKIEILRGPAASAQYGSLGMHGVVVVTTKRGHPLPAPSVPTSTMRCPDWPS